MVAVVEWTLREVTFKNIKPQRVMKTKALVLIALAAVVTLSFTFASVSKSDKKGRIETKVATHQEPIGGFVMEDKL